RRDLVAEAERLDFGPAVELPQPRLVAADRAPERRGELLAVAQVVAIGQQDAVGTAVLGDLLDAAVGHARVDEGGGNDCEVRVHLRADALVVRRPVQYAGKDLLHRGRDLLGPGGGREAIER